MADDVLWNATNSQKLVVEKGSPLQVSTQVYFYDPKKDHFDCSSASPRNLVHPAEQQLCAPHPHKTEFGFFPQHHWPVENGCVQ